MTGQAGPDRLADQADGRFLTLALFGDEPDHLNEPVGPWRIAARVRARCPDDGFDDFWQAVAEES